MSLLEQVRTYGALVDIQGKGYSARLKLLLHSGRPVLLCARPWCEFFHASLRPWVRTHGEECGRLGGAVGWLATAVFSG